MFRLIIWNELRDLFIAIFPPAPIREKLKSATSLTAILALFGFLLCAMSIVFSYRSYHDGLMTYTDPQTAQIFAYVVSVFIGVFMTIAINLFAHNVAEGLFSWGNFLPSVTLACLVTGGAIGYFDMHRMKVGGEYIAENIVGEEASLIAAENPEYLRQRRDLERRAAQALSVAAWDSRNNCGGKVIERDGRFQIVSVKTDGPIAISGPGVNATTRKAHRDHDRMMEEIRVLDARQRQREDDYRTAAASANAKRAGKLETISGTFQNVTTYLYGLQLVLALFQFSILVSAAKKAGVSLTGEVVDMDEESTVSEGKSWVGSRPFAGFAQAHHREADTGDLSDPKETIDGKVQAAGKDAEIGLHADRAYRPLTVHTTANQDGYEITCKHCQQKAVMKSARAKYCSEKCRKEAYNQRNPKKPLRV